MRFQLARRCYTIVVSIFFPMIPIYPQHNFRMPILMSFRGDDYSAHTLSKSCRGTHWDNIRVMYRDDGNEHGNYYIMMRYILGLYRDYSDWTFLQAHRALTIVRDSVCPFQCIVPSPQTSMELPGDIVTVHSDSSLCRAPC